MKINTRYFGDVEFSENDVINFPVGIVGFEQFDKYILIKFDEDNNAMFCLQGIDDGAPVFIVFNPFEIVDNYQPEISSADMNDIECTDESGVEYYVIANIAQPMENTVVNLKSPIAVNIANKHAKQIIMSKYELRHPMFTKTEE
jgi:flagellar assembly factor FliW